MPVNETVPKLIKALLTWCNRQYPQKDTFKAFIEDVNNQTIEPIEHDIKACVSIYVDLEQPLIPVTIDDVDYVLVGASCRSIPDSGLTAFRIYLGQLLPLFVQRHSPWVAAYMLTTETAALVSDGSPMTYTWTCRQVKLYNDDTSGGMEYFITNSFTKEQLDYVFDYFDSKNKHDAIVEPEEHSAPQESTKENPIARELADKIVQHITHAKLTTDPSQVVDALYQFARSHLSVYSKNIYWIIEHQNHFLQGTDSGIVTVDIAALGLPTLRAQNMALVVGATYTESPILENSMIHVYFIQRMWDALSASTLYREGVAMFPMDLSTIKTALTVTSLGDPKKGFPKGSRSRHVIDTFFDEQLSKYFESDIEVQNRNTTDILSALKSIDIMYECRLHVISRPSPFTDANTYTQMNATADTEKLEALKDYRQQVHDLIEKYTTD